MSQEPLSPAQARKRLSECLREDLGHVRLSPHCIREMQNDDLTPNDIINILRGGQITEPAEFERDSWRYRVHSNTIYVVFAFWPKNDIRVITTWRKKRRGR